ncbi:hypothetical protein [Salipiger mucosus]|uniref:hypothetical protein n=1 Tax=Salipiger mucosus TaxID=263378 RepID=UPI00037D1BEC|nr:hypothetical protein [Salipiger mucosus]
MTPQQIKGLALVRKVRNIELEKQAGHLGELRQKESMLDGEKARLDGLLRRDNAKQPVETAGYIPLFVKSVKAQTGIIDSHLVETRQKRAEQEAAVRASFAEVKTLDHVIGSARTRLREAEEKRDRAELEEIALMIHQKRKTAVGGEPVGRQHSPA